MTRRRHTFRIGLVFWAVLFGVAHIGLKACLVACLVGLAQKIDVSEDEPRRARVIAIHDNADYWR
jgi:hypothetical protein